MKAPACVGDGASAIAWGLIDFGINFPTVPVLIATLQHLNNQNPGHNAVRARAVGTSRTPISCDGANSQVADAVHWIAIRPGVHTIDGKLVQAGHVAGASNNTAVMFNAAFPSMPVVLVFGDEEGGGVRYQRVFDVTANGFKLFHDLGTPNTLHWIALQPGDYVHGNARWRAGLIANQFFTPFNCTECTHNFVPELPSTPGVVATIFDTNNSGSRYVRIRSATSTQLKFTLEQLNTTEIINYVAFWKID